MTMPSGTNFEIIAGTYEEYLLGYIFSSEEQSLVHSFASHDHSSSVRCLATYGNYLASGASDDRIIIYDLKTRKEHCMLTHHESTISAVAFTKNHSHVISASQDGALAMVRVGNWQLEKQWEKAHKGGYILDMAMHSSGKLALTLGTDCTIHTWNLVKGRAAYIINLTTKCKDPKSLERIIFAPDDTRFVLFGGQCTEIWSIEIGGALQVIDHEQKVTCCDWLDNDTLFVGYEDGQLGTINLESRKRKIKQGHSGRVKVVQHFEGFIVTASSAGQIKVWTRKLKELTSIDTGCRITCICIAQLVGKLKKEEPKEEATVKQVVAKKPVKRSVVVEVEDGSDDAAEKIRVRAKKNKKARRQRNKAVGHDIVVEDEESHQPEVSKNVKIKKKNKRNIEKILAEQEDSSIYSAEHDTIIKKKHITEVKHRSNLKLKKKKTKKIKTGNKIGK